MVGPKGRFSDPIQLQGCIDLMVKHGQVGLDSGRMYAEGTAEKVYCYVSSIKESTLMLMPLLSSSRSVISRVPGSIPRFFQ